MKSIAISGRGRGNLAKFTAPIVVNGKVYVVSQSAPDGGKLLVYGLRP